MVNDQQGRCLVALQHWLSTLYSHQLAKYSEDGVVHVSHEVAGRFSIGTVDESVFLAVQQIEMRWVEGMPWEYAAVYRGKKEIYLVASPIEIDGADTPPFGLSFEMQSVIEAEALYSYGMLELRRSLATVADSKKSRILERTAFAEMPILLLDEDAPLFASGSTKKTVKAGARSGT